MVGKIEPRFGAEVYVGDCYDVCIKQYRDGEEEQVVILNREEAKELIKLLDAGIKESVRLEEENEVNS